MAAPNNHTDPYWTQLADAAGEKLDLPAGLLASIVTRGERSNNDQVSEAGAKTVFQIIPATRDAAIKKWGIDPYLSPENAAEVAGLLLKDSLKRNNNDTAAAVGEYVGGIDRKNWGPITKSYINRVMSGQRSFEKTSQAAATPRAQPQSTFDRVSSQNAPQAAQSPQIAAIYGAYQSGQMTPEESAEFETDVNSGALILPRGAALKSSGAPAAAGGEVLPTGVLDAYADGRMSVEDKAALESDLAAGVVQLPPGAKLGNSSAIAQIPGIAGANVQTTKEADPSFVDRVIGGGEAALALGTGAVGGAIGGIGGALGGLAGSIVSGDIGTQRGVQGVEQAAADGAAKLTYQPRTAEGQRQAQIAGEALGELAPVTGLVGEGAMLAQAAGQAARVAAPVAATASSAARAVPAQAVAAARRVLPAAEEAPRPTPGTMASGGSAGTDMATQRRVNAQSLPVPIDLTKGQAERSFELQRFEREAAKDSELGDPIRQRYAEQNAQIVQNLDAFIDSTGAQAPTLRAVGQAVDKALVAKAAQDKTRIRVAYKNAEKAGELAAPVSLKTVVDYLNESAPDAATAPLLNTARQWAVKLGIAEEKGGELVPVRAKASSGSSLMNAAQPEQAITLGTAERFRQAINRNTDYEPTNIRQSAIIKGLIDQATENQGGDLYRSARRLRENFANQYENHAVISNLLDRKRGMNDRKVAFEDVFDRSVLQGSLDDVRQVRRVLQTGGEDGQQAWRELQGQTIAYIKDQATKNVSTDIRGNRIVSPAGIDKAIANLDRDGKLDFLFGKKGAQQLRDINDLVKHVHTAPPGTINSSNTASVLLAALDIAISGSAGVPLPVASGVRLLTKHIKDRRLKERINDSLRDPTRKPDIQAPAPKKTIH